MEIKLLKIFEFKTDKIKQEFLSGELDYRLQIIIYALAGFVYHRYGKGLLFTEIFRTKETQDKYYADDPIYKQKKWLSTHQYWRAADISIRYFTPQEIREIVIFLKHFSYDVPSKSVVLVHDIGLGAHIHLQVDNTDKTQVTK